ncbi:MAG: hypothetical protein AAF846_27960 [Chloroflexota bacterium]
MSRQDALRQIRQDAMTHSALLMGWSMLYYIHCYPELNISHAEFAAITPVNVRTLQRYKKRVLNLLLQQIVELELNLCNATHSEDILS